MVHVGYLIYIWYVPLDSHSIWDFHINYGEFKTKIETAMHGNLENNFCYDVFLNKTCEYISMYPLK